jgi:hypothetical protein
MNAGLPGLGLSGLFVVLTTLGMPLVRARRRRRSWQPLFVLAALVATVGVLGWIAASLFVAGPLGGRRTHSGSVVGLPVFVLSLAILAVLLLAPEVLLWTIGTRPTPALPPVPARGTKPISAPADGAEHEPDPHSAEMAAAEACAITGPVPQPAKRGPQRSVA